MTNPHASPPLGSQVAARDMWFHEPRYRDYTWLETNWFSWLIPEERMRGHIRAAFRTNLGVVESTAFVFSGDDPSAGPMGADFDAAHNHVPMPPQNLNHYDLASGLSVRMVKPMQEWHVRYDGPNDTVFDLKYEALMPPVLVSETGVLDGNSSPPIKHGHIDQTMAVTGEVLVDGRRHQVAWPSQRDHSWSPRPETSSTGYGHAVCTNFDSGHFGNDFSFLVQTNNDWTDLRRGVVQSGYLLDHGRLKRLKAGEGRYEFFDNSWTISSIVYDLEDEDGRQHQLIGEPCSFYQLGTGVRLALVKWRAEDEVGWGEYLWHGDFFEMRRLGHP